MATNEENGSRIQESIEKSIVHRKTKPPTDPPLNQSDSASTTNQTTDSGEAD